MTTKPKGRIPGSEAASALRDPLAWTADRAKAIPSDPGWMAGRFIDGHWFAQDGRAAVWRPPTWIRLLEAAGYDRAAEGEPVFVVSEMRLGELARFDDLREAFRFALGAIQGKPHRHPESLAIDCRTASGRIVPVVWGRPVVGMARGALEAEPIRTLEAPAD